LTRATRSRGPLSRGLSAINRDLRRNAVLYLMALPGGVVLFVVNYLPRPRIILAFMNYKAATGTWGSVWVGLQGAGGGVAMKGGVFSWGKL